MNHKIALSLPEKLSMQTIKVIQIGLGPLGLKIANMIADRRGVETVAAVDINPALSGKKLGDLCANPAIDVQIENDLEKAVEKAKPDIAVLTTVSDLERIVSQLEAIAKLGLPIVSTCEELSYPWDVNRKLAEQIDSIAKKHQVAVLATGVNPGFLMDALPMTLTAVCQEVSKITVRRFQDAQFRRIPFQKKIGAGLDLRAFSEKMHAKTLRHVGLTESMHMIASRMGWQLDRTEDNISPVIAKEELKTAAMTIPKGNATGVRQEGRGYQNGVLKVELIFQAAVGEVESFEEVIIEGNPPIHSKIKGGVNGDIATGAIVINAIPVVLNASEGLKTMADIPPVTFFE